MAKTVGQGAEIGGRTLFEPPCLCHRIGGKESGTGNGVVVSQQLMRIALVGVAVAALLVSGCGRKGPLEAPPSASGLAAAPPPSSPALGEPEHSALEGERTAELPPSAPAKKTFFLDWLVK
jgi:predicted small lipoprotein YifL